jgi:hypothetical protein
MSESSSVPSAAAVDLKRLVRHIAGLRGKADEIESQCASQGDHEREESRVAWLHDEADALESFIVPNAEVSDGDEPPQT